MSVAERIKSWWRGRELPIHLQYGALGERAAKKFVQSLHAGVRAGGALREWSMWTLRNRNGVRRGLGEMVMAVTVAVSISAMRICRRVERRVLVRVRCRFAFHFVSVYFVRGTCTDDRACGCCC